MKLDCLYFITEHMDVTSTLQRTTLTAVATFVTHDRIKLVKNNTEDEKLFHARGQVFAGEIDQAMKLSKSFSVLQLETSILSFSKMKIDQHFSNATNLILIDLEQYSSTITTSISVWLQ